jgi:hypothetical protein
MKARVLVAKFAFSTLLWATFFNRLTEKMQRMLSRK